VVRDLEATCSYRQRRWMDQFTARERYRCIKPILDGALSVTEAAQQTAVSRQRLHMWLARYHEGGMAGLATRASVPKTTPHAISPEVGGRICALRAEHPTWGPKKLKAWLQKQEPRGDWPALSTIGDLLQRRGLVATKRQRRRRAKHAPRSFQPAVQPNDTWCMDFKGHFALQRGGRCHPLTTQDFVSRYLLIAEALPSEHDALMWPVLERAFVEYGLPRTIRHDNGHPFASPGPGGLSRLSVRLIKLGIVVERTALASPSQNGKLERMHRVMKAEVASPPEATMTAQQRALERFRREYNDERPHEALGLVTPASCYEPSPRTYLGHVPEIEYGTDVTPRRIYSTGVMKWRGHSIFVGAVLGGELVSLRTVGDGVLEMRFGNTFLGILDEALPAAGLIRNREK